MMGSNRRIIYCRIRVNVLCYVGCFVSGIVEDIVKDV